MISTITTTHAIPVSLPPTRLRARRNMVTCNYCFQSLGLAEGAKERKALLARHICKEKLMARQPSVAVPFS